jgi:hypothetical protein
MQGDSLGVPPSHIHVDEEAKQDTARGWIALLSFFALLLVGIFWMAYSEWKKLAVASKMAEGRNVVGAMARGMLACVERNQQIDPPSSATCTADVKRRPTLPPSTHAVPPTLGEIGERGYRSQPSDWSDETFVCAGFTAPSLQHFQVQWIRSSRTRGVVRATTNMPYEGHATTTYEVPIVCETGRQDSSREPIWGFCQEGEMIESH